MDKSKFQYIALVIAVILGLVIGGSIMSGIKDSQINKLNAQHTKEIEQQIILDKQRTVQRNDSIAQIQKRGVQDSILITHLQDRIRTDSISTVKRRIEAKKLTTNEKVDFIRKHLP